MDSAVGNGERCSVGGVASRGEHPGEAALVGERTDDCGAEQRGHGNIPMGPTTVRIPGRQTAQHLCPLHRGEKHRRQDRHRPHTAG